jgi:putative inorganic carbon (HCO3(-)) transporter
LTGREFPDHQVVAALSLAGAAFYLLPWAPAYLLALLAVAALSWYRLDLALLLVVIFAPFFMLPKHIGGKEFAPSEIFIVLDAVLAGGYILHPAKRPRLDWSKLLRSPFLVPALLFLLAAAVSATFAADHHQALQAFRERILEPVAFFALLTLLAARSSHWQWLFTALIASGVIVGAVGLVQRATNQNLTVDAGIKKIHSVYGSPDNVGLLFDRAIPVWLALGMAGRLRRIHWLPWLGAGIVLIPALTLTYSRGAWVAIAVAAVGLVAVLRHWGRWFVLAGFIGLVGAIVLEGPSLQRAFSSGHAGTVHQRFYIWHSAVRMIEDHPILGIGPDNFLHYYAPRPAPHQYFQRFCPNGLGYIEPQAGAEPCLSHPHNAILDAWLSTGIVGLAAFIWLEVVFWGALWRAYPSSSELPGLILGAGAAMLASLIHGMVDNMYFLPDLAILFWLLCGFASYLATASPVQRLRSIDVGGREPPDTHRRSEYPGPMYG